MVKAADFRWRVLSTQERVQLGGVAERFTVLLHSVLALQAVAQRRSVGRDATGIALPSARTRPKKTAMDSVAEHRFASGETPAMPASKPKDCVITNAPMASSDILQSIIRIAVFHALHESKCNR